ncbi:MAG: hypothetical protein IJ412_01880 [Oscillospiraceae bacterium]|nr:hypothetical protein [Oscillospiraceae bacterium]
MKMEYESPVLEVFFFTVKDTVMDSGQCSSFECPDGICAVDGICVTDGGIPNISSL